MPADNKLWIPPLSPKDQRKINRHQRYQRLVKWTGFSDKTLWDWLQLSAVLAIPIVIAAGTLWFSVQQTQASSQASERQHQTDLQVANDQQQENALQTYLGQMSNLLLNNKLYESEPGDEVRTVARSRILTVLPQINSTRKGELVRFLKEAGLIDVKNAIISLNGVNLRDADLNFVDLSYTDLRHADLNNANLSHADLNNANLSGTHLSHTDLFSAHLSYADLSYTDLSYAILSYTDLHHADLSYINLNNADLNNADLSHVILGNADLSNANLSHTDLSYAILDDTNLNNANLSYADLSHADLFLAHLSYADLSHAEVTNKQLANAWSLQDTTMPNGSKHP